MATRKKVKVLESGDIYFFCQSKERNYKLNEKSSKKLKKVQRFYSVLCPTTREIYRALKLGRKRFPYPTLEEKHWAVVDLVTNNHQALLQNLLEKFVVIKTQSKQEQPTIKACGKGGYAIVSAARKTYLLYNLGLVSKEGKAQQEFDFKQKASYVICVKNKKVNGKTNKAKVAKSLGSKQKKFNNLKYMAVNNVELLNYTGVELLLVDSPLNVEDELGIKSLTFQGTCKSVDLLAEINR